MDGTIYALQGDKVNAIASFAAIVPVGGTALKFGIKGIGKIGIKELEQQGFRSFSSFKRAMGPAGPGQAWHHIVEQHADNVAKFGAESIHNVNNLIKLPHGAGSIHAKVSGFYSSKQPFTRGQTVRQWLIKVIKNNMILELKF